MYHNNRHTKRDFRAPKLKFGKKLDPMLFVKKAEEQVLQPKEITSTAKFSDFALCDKLKRNIALHGYEVPTPIQQESIPQLLLGRDLIGIANTGTGKTAAFLISLLNKCYIDRNQRVLIIVPTRELAVQIKDEFDLFSKGMDMEAAVLIGGANMKRQIYQLRHRPHFVIATPGRLKDIIKKREINLFMYQNIVLDEVDRMVDIGFIHDIKYIISLLPKVRQSLFFSATIDRKAEEILSTFVKNPITVSVKKENTNENIDQDIIKIGRGKQKIDILHDLLIQPGFDKVMIFGRTKWGMEKLHKSLLQRGFRSAAIHGNKTQGQRQRAIEDFKSDRLNILVATDVASRGLDIENVTHVINYDAPQSYDDYVHRIGRTGRAGKKGTALTFVE
jgi:superfamily II DNA/RNA helicase